MTKPQLIPQVEKLEMGKGSFELTSKSRILAASQGAKDAAGLLAEYLRPATGFPLPVVSGAPKEGDIVLSEKGKGKADEAGFFDESYGIDIDGKLVKLTAANGAGLLRAIQTFRQLLPAEIYGGKVAKKVQWTVPALKISDAPAFRWRGLHFDVSRHFFTVEEVCRFIELMAQHKFNIFHWHLTDDQGWRVEIKKYPKLTSVGSIRKETLIGHYNDWPHKFDGKKHSGFYTQEEMRKIVAFAGRRGVTIVPEIDMPGHMQAAITAYPELGNTPSLNPGLRTIWGISQNILFPSEKTVKFMQDVLAEVMEIFPSRFIHIGGDEALKHEWETSTAVNKLMAEYSCKDCHELQSHFIGEMGKFIAKSGRRMIGWDEILEGGLAKEFAVMSWRGEDGAIKAARDGHDVVNASSTHTYLDHYQADSRYEPLAIGGDLTCEKAYRYNPIPSCLTPAQGKHVLGGQGQVWTEYIPTFSQVEYMTYPRACALGEKLWGKEGQSRFRDFVDRLAVHRQRLAAQQVNAHDLP